ncbi:MAG: HD domain-containing protein [Chthonomonadales bacterium]|nr:HD domain-containing protein [Chthonomonadales bacterium]
MDTSQRLEAILALAREYEYDPLHAHQVECLAGTLFMEMAEFHKLDRDDRKLLEYAAILHDIGYKVGGAGHHRHALMMILTEPLPAFSRTEVKVIANIARYHRKALPSPEHTMFGVLDDGDRQRVAVLAALLRVADALDRSHKGLVRELTCQVTESEVILNAVSETELPLEAAALDRRGDLFRAVFRKTPRLAVELPKLATPQAVFETV